MWGTGAMAGLLAELSDEATSAAELQGDLPGAVIFADEEGHVRDAVPARRREFATGRACARVAMIRHGIAPATVPADARGAPIWPRGLVGSITHCRGFRAGAVASSARLSGMGIDAEPSRVLAPVVLAGIATPRERAWLAGPDPEGRRGTLLFSAKEAAIKLRYQLTGVPLGLRQVEVEIGAEDLRVRLVRPEDTRHLGGELRGCWRLAYGLVLTAIVAPRGAREWRRV